MNNFKEELNDEQYRVVTEGDGPCLVLAGAGSGKTRTITYRVAYLLEQGISPESILLVTFTNKAAQEMKERVAEIMGTTASSSVERKGLPWSGTFHHIAFRILRQYAAVLGYQNNFTILDSEDSRDLLKLCLKGEGVDRKAKRFPNAKVINGMISYARNASLSLSDLIIKRYSQWADMADVFSRIASDYAKRKKEANAMDFDDLLVNLQLLLLQSQSVRERFTKQFHYVLVDEYQDTNKIQAAIVRLMSSHHHNLLVVGDDAQSIYSFRAADIQNILDFEMMYPDTKVFRLETNYRSTPDILDVANDVISHNESQYKKSLRSVRDPFSLPEVHPFSDQREEAEFIADKILELHDEGVDLQNIAVLFRAAFHSQALEVELVKRDIPYDYRGGVRFFERAHIKDVLAYVRLFVNPHDTIAWSRVLNMQVGTGPSTVGKMIHEIQQHISLQEGLRSHDESAISLPLLTMKDAYQKVSDMLSVRAKKGWNDFRMIYEEMEQDKEQTSSSLVRAVMSSRYEEHLMAEYNDYRDRLQDISQLAVFAERESDVTKFLGEISLQESFTAAQTQSAAFDDDEKIVLSTIHQAKGLEWDTVFVIGMADGQFPMEKARQAGELDEERRLFYVAITRAERLLYMSYPLVGGFNSALGGPSLFLNELPAELIVQKDFRDVMTSVFNDPSDDVDDVQYVAEDDGWGSGDRKPKRKSFLMDI